MNGLLAVLISTISFSVINLKFKQLRNKGVDTKTTLSLFSFGVPLLVILGIYLFINFTPFVSLKYLLIILIWMVTVSISIFGKYYLYRFKGLTELTSYRIAFSTLIAMVLDVFYFQTPYNILTVVAILLLISSGYILSKNQLKIKNISLKMVFGITFISGLFKALDYLVYKQGLLFQDHILFHVVFTQIILYTVFYFVGRKSLLKNIKEKKIVFKDGILVGILVFIAVIAESFAVSELPIALVISAGTIPIVLYSVYDFKNKEIRLHRTSILAVMMIIGGVAMLGFFR